LFRLVGNSVRTLEELAEALNVDKSIVSDCLHAMGKIQKESKWVNCLNLKSFNSFALHCFCVTKRSNFYINCNWRRKLNLLW